MIVTSGVIMQPWFALVYVVALYVVILIVAWLRDKYL